jgi:hypothetical protein
MNFAMVVLLGSIMGLLFSIASDVDDMADDVREIRNIEVANYNDRIERENPR